MHFLFYRISSCLFFGDATHCFSSKRRTLLLLLKKPENPSNPHLHLICHSGFDSGVIFVTLYSFFIYSTIYYYYYYLFYFFIYLIAYLFSSLLSIVVFCIRKTYVATDLSVHALLSLLFFSLALTCGMLRVIRTLNILAQVIL